MGVRVPPWVPKKDRFMRSFFVLRGRDEFRAPATRPGSKRTGTHTGVRRSDLRSGDGVMRSISPKDFERSSSNPIPPWVPKKKTASCGLFLASYTDYRSREKRVRTFFKKAYPILNASLPNSSVLSRTFGFVHIHIWFVV